MANERRIRQRMTAEKGRVSRRNFLQLRPVDRGRTIELSVRTLFESCADSNVNELLEDFARQLEGIRVLKLFEPEWLESMDASERVRAVLAEFEARGGRVEEQW